MSQGDAAQEIHDGRCRIWLMTGGLQLLNFR